MCKCVCDIFWQYSLTFVFVYLLYVGTCACMYKYMTIDKTKQCYKTDEIINHAINSNCLFGEVKIRHGRR